MTRSLSGWLGGIVLYSLLRLSCLTPQLNYIDKRWLLLSRLLKMMGSGQFLLHNVHVPNSVALSQLDGSLSQPRWRQRASRVTGASGCTHLRLLSSFYSILLQVFTVIKTQKRWGELDYELKQCFILQLRGAGWLVRVGTYMHAYAFTHISMCLLSPLYTYLQG